MRPNPAAAVQLRAERPRLRPRRAANPAYRTALTSVLRPLALVAVAMLGILLLLPAALHAAAL